MAKTNTPHYLDVLCQAPTTGPKQYADIFEYFQAKKNATSLWLHICTNGLQIQAKRHFNSIGVAFT